MHQFSIFLFFCQPACFGPGLNWIGKISCGELEAGRLLCRFFMNEIEQINEGQSPAQRAGLVAWLACLLCLASLFFFAKPAVDLMEIWWEQLLIFALVPTLTAFFILFLSSVHREMKIVRRIFFLLLLALLDFGAVLLFTALVALVLFSFAHLGSGHG
jgi:hypothetical protein